MPINPEGFIYRIKSGSADMLIIYANMTHSACSIMASTGTNVLFFERKGVLATMLRSFSNFFQEVQSAPEFLHTETLQVCMGNSDLL